MSNKIIGQQSQTRKKALVFLKRKGAKKKLNWTSTFTEHTSSCESKKLQRILIWRKKLGKDQPPSSSKSSSTSSSTKHSWTSSSTKSFICKSCQNGPTYKKAHHPQCRFSQNRRKNKVEQISDSEKKKRKQSFFLPSLKIPNVSKSSSSKDIIVTPSVIAKASSSSSVIAKPSSLSSVIAKPSSSSSVIAKPSSLPKTPSKLSLPYRLCITPDLLKKVVKKKMDECKEKQKGRKVPIQLEAVIEFILGYIPPKAGISQSKRAQVETSKYETYRELFPFNTCSITVPEDKSPTSPPDPNYTLIENRTIHFLHWQLINNMDISKLTCPNCHKGDLITLQWDYTKDGGKVTPLFSIGEPTSFTICMKYKCTNHECKKIVDASDPC